MNIDSNQILEDYTKSPIGYMNKLDNNIHSANILISLLKQTNNDPTLMQHIIDYCYIDIKNITATVHTLNEHLALIELIYVKGPFGYETLKIYYTENYRDESIMYKEGIQVNCFLLDNLISKFSRIDPNQYGRGCLLEDILVTLPAIIDLAKHSKNTTIENKKVLSTSMLLYYLLEKTEHTDMKPNIYSKRLDMIEALNSIAFELYGNKKDSVLSIARTLNFMDNKDYWKSCIEDLSAKYDNQDLLPIF